jgi:hypothetical protein
MISELAGVTGLRIVDKLQSYESCVSPAWYICSCSQQLACVDCQSRNRTVYMFSPFVACAVSFILSFWRKNIRDISPWITGQRQSIVIFITPNYVMSKEVCWWVKIYFYQTHKRYEGKHFNPFSNLIVNIRRRATLLYFLMMQFV